MVLTWLDFWEPVYNILECLRRTKGTKMTHAEKMKRKSTRLLCAGCFKPLVRAKHYGQWGYTACSCGSMEVTRTPAPEAKE